MPTQPENSVYREQKLWKSKPIATQATIQKPPMRGKQQQEPEAQHHLQGQAASLQLMSKADRGVEIMQRAHLLHYQMVALTKASKLNRSSKSTGEADPFTKWSNRLDVTRTKTSCSRARSNIV